MLDTFRPYTLDRTVRLILTLAVAAGLVWLVGYVADVLVPLAVALLAAYLLHPLVKLVQRRLKARTPAVLVTVGGLLALLLGVTLLIGPVVSREFTTAIAMFRGFVEEGSPLRQRMRAALPPAAHQWIESLLRAEDLQRFLAENAELRAAAVSAVKWAVPHLWGIVSGVLAVLGLTAQVFLVLLYLVFILIDYERLERRWKDYLPPRYRQGIVAFLGDFNQALARYFRGQFIVAACAGVLLAAGFALMGLRMGILLGLAIGLLNMVPYLQVVGLPPAYLLAAMTAWDRGGSVWWYAGGVTAVFLVAQVLGDAVITPRVVGRATGLRPVVILFCVLFWGKLLGFLGLLLAIPLTCLGLAYYNHLLAGQQGEATTGA